MVEDFKDSRAVGFKTGDPLGFKGPMVYGFWFESKGRGAWICNPKRLNPETLNPKT